jgi:hypothetical protein
MASGAALAQAPAGPPKWTLRGEYMESCNCDYICPCIYTNPQAPATNDHCTAVMVFRIDEGNFGETMLEGLKFALVIRSGKVHGPRQLDLRRGRRQQRQRGPADRSPPSSGAKPAGRRQSSAKTW